MIVLKILLIIILAILGLILLLLSMPVSAEIRFVNDRFHYSLKYAFIEVLNSKGGGLLGKQKKDNEPKIYSFQSEFSMKEENEDNTETQQNQAPKDTEKSEKVKERSDESCSKIKDTKVEEHDYDTENLSNNKKESSENTASNKTKKEKTLGEKVDFLMKLWKCAKHPVRKILKGFHINNLYIDFIIANEDAYKCAVNYGRIGGLIYNLLAAVNSIFSVKYDEVKITPGFARKESRWDVECKIWFMPITAVIMAAWFGITFIFRVYIPSKRKYKKSRRKAE